MKANDLRRIVCWLRGHRWRRLNKQERIIQHNGFVPQYRICNRCHATRIAAKRKPKGVSA